MDQFQTKQPLLPEVQIDKFKETEVGRKQQRQTTVYSILNDKKIIDAIIATKAQTKEAKRN